CRQIVPEGHAQLRKRHIAALLQWQPFAAILKVFGFKLAPVRLPGLYQSTCGGFLYPATYAAGDQAPA
ncbi:hypothetical protein K802_00955, partial [Salmonella enterica subsp. enterica serovar Newport str. SHSN012]